MKFDIQWVTELTYKYCIVTEIFSSFPGWNTEVCFKGSLNYSNNTQCKHELLDCGMLLEFFTCTTTKLFDSTIQLLYRCKWYLLKHSKAKLFPVLPWLTVLGSAVNISGWSENLFSVAIFFINIINSLFTH